MKSFVQLGNTLKMKETQVCLRLGNLKIPIRISTCGGADNKSTFFTPNFELKTIDIGFLSQKTKGKRFTKSQIPPAFLQSKQTQNWKIRD